MELDSSFEDDLRDAVLDEAAATLRDDLGPEFERVARENWQAYAGEQGYDIDHIWDDVEGPFVERGADSVRIRVEWPELTALFEWGVDPHVITGDLHFYWQEKDMWVQTDSVDWGSETGGIPESRAIRDALGWLRREVQS